MAKQKKIKPTRDGTTALRDAAHRTVRGRSLPNGTSIRFDEWGSYINPVSYRSGDVTVGVNVGKRERSNRGRLEQAMRYLAGGRAANPALVAGAFANEFGERCRQVISPMLDVLATKSADRWHHTTIGTDAQQRRLGSGYMGVSHLVARGCYAMKAELSEADPVSFPEAVTFYKHADAMTAATDSGDIRQVVDIAYKVCDELGWIEHPQDQQPEPEQGQQPEDSEGENQQDTEGGSDSGGDEQQSDTEEQPSDEQGDSDSDSQGGDQSSDQQDERMGRVHDVADKVEEAQVQPKQPTHQTSTSQAQSGSGWTDGHSYTEIGNIACTEDTVHENLKGILEHFMTPTMSLSDDFSGSVSDYAAELNFGNLDVFYADKREAGRIVIGVDCSGSMGNGVSYRQGMLDAESIYTGGKTNNSFLAWQCAMALSKAFPEAVVFGYHGGDIHTGGMTKIGQIVAGQRPADEYEFTAEHAAALANRFPVAGGATPECTAMLYMKQLLGGRLDGASGVIITDGYPNDIKHTAEVARAMVGSGFSFGVVRVGPAMSRKQVEKDANRKSYKRLGGVYLAYVEGMQYLLDHNMQLYPQQASVEIERISDMPKLARIMEYLRERG